MNKGKARKQSMMVDGKNVISITFKKNSLETNNKVQALDLKKNTQELKANEKKRKVCILNAHI